MSEETLKTYRGNCHCGAFIYEVKLPEIKAYSECNCSICYKTGYAWLFPNAGDLDIVKGSIDDLKAYTFNKGDYVYRFCSNCGTSVVADFPNEQSGRTTAINVSGASYLICNRRAGWTVLTPDQRHVLSRGWTSGPWTSSRRLQLCGIRTLLLLISQKIRRQGHPTSV